MSSPSSKPKKKLSAKNMGAALLMGLLALSLVGFGVEGFGSSGRNVATVGARDITANAYARALQNELRAIQQQSGQAFTMEQARMFGIEQSVLQQLVTQAALNNEAGNLGISAGDATVQRQLLEVPSFQGVTGNFDREAYRFSLQSAGLTEAEFEESLRDDVARTILQLSVIGGVDAPDAQAQAIFAFQAQTRDLSILTLDAGDVAQPVGSPDADTLRAYYEANLERYTLDEGKRIRYAMITPDMLFDTIEVDEAQLQAAYDARLSEFVQPERRLVERLVFPDQDSAAEAMQRINSGEADFETIVAERGLSLEDTDMGDVTQDQLGSAGAAVFALDGPGVTGPVETSLGPAIFRMNAVLAARETPLDEAAPELRDELVADRARRMIAEEIELYEDLLAGGATVAQLAEETAMQQGELDWRPGVTEGIAGYESFRQAARDSAPGGFAEIALLEDGGAFALEVVEIIPAAPRPLADIRAEVLRNWRQEETVARLRAQAEDIVAAIEAGQDFADLGEVPERIEDASRRDFLPELPETIIARAFDIDPGALAIVEDPARVHILRVDAVHDPDPAMEDVARIRTQIVQAIRQSYAQDLFQYFATGLLDQTPVQINQPVIDAVQANF